MLNNSVMMNSINTPKQITKIKENKWSNKLNSPQAHDIMAIGIDSNDKVTNFPLLFQFLLTVFSAHTMPKPLALGISKFFTIILTHLQFTLDKLQINYQLTHTSMCVPENLPLSLLESGRWNIPPPLDGTLEIPDVWRCD